MIGFLRRLQPRNPVLAVLYWIVLVVLAVALLFAIFFLLDEVFGLAPFDAPSV
ncbi:MAG TPA: hypothetical protein VJ868_10130 [Actinomycetota bacterium]|nr:hypothetical protein [Actinomycetota bacterium]